MALLLTVTATCRLIRLVAVDSITARLRVGVIDAVRRRSDRAGDAAATLIGCPFCLGWWISVGMVAGWWWVGHTVWWWAALTALGVSWMAGQLSALFDR